MQNAKIQNLKWKIHLETTKDKVSQLKDRSKETILSEDLKEKRSV
jgi:hypothetical protein